MVELTQEEFYARLPKKRVASAAMFWNQAGELLILHKTYDDNRWNLPGGVTEFNESPRVGLIREVKEEINLDKTDFSFVGLDYKPPRSVILSESLQFIFDGGILSDEEIANIKISEEHSEFKFLPFEEAVKILSFYLGLRLSAIMSSEVRPVYLEKGVKV